MIWNTSLSEAEKRQMAAYKYSSNFETALTNSILIIRMPLECYQAFERFRMNYSSFVIAAQ